MNTKTAMNTKSETHDFSLKHANKLSAELKRQSKDICAMNHCTSEEHYCESYAYISKDGWILDICYPDYFQGTSKSHAAICLPWSGTGKELRDEIEEQTFED